MRPLNSVERNHTEGLKQTLLQIAEDKAVDGKLSLEAVKELLGFCIDVSWLECVNEVHLRQMNRGSDTYEN